MKGKSMIQIASLLLGINLILAGCGSQFSDSETVSAESRQQISTEEYSSEEIAGSTAKSLAGSRESYEVETEEITVDSENGSIYAVLYRPFGKKGSLPTVVFSHGYGDTNRGGRQYAQALAEQGYLVCCFDFRGGGPDSKSEGSNLDMTIFTEQADLEAVLDMLHNRSEVDQNHIFLLGNSQGGVVSAITAAKREDEIAGLILSSPAFSLVEDAKELFGSKDNIPDTYFHMLMEVGEDYFASVMDYDVFDSITDYEGDVLIFHGDQDNLVPISYSRQAVDVFPHAELEVLSGEGHMYSQNAVQQSISIMSNFLADHLSDNGARNGLIAEQILDGADGEIHYSYYLPETYDESKNYPMMVVMPGYDMMWFGEDSSGSNLNWQGFLAWTELDEDMIVVSAQLTDWGGKSARQAVELTEYFLQNFSVDTSRVYAAGYSAGGETMSQAVSMRPDLYAAYLHGASQWDGTYAPIAENQVAVYIYMAEGDEYYGSGKARDAYDNLLAAYRETGLPDNKVEQLLQVEIPDDAFFNQQGIYNYHGGANVVFDDETILNWIVQQEKG